MNIPQHLSPKRLRFVMKMAGRKAGRLAPVATGVAGGILADRAQRRPNETTAEAGKRRKIDVDVALGAAGLHHNLATYPSARRRVTRMLQNAGGREGSSLSKLADRYPSVDHSLAAIMSHAIPERSPAGLEKAMHPFRAARAGRMLKAKDARYKNDFRRAGIKI